MNQTILSNYEITSQTMALLSVAHLDYCTIALEPSQEFYINKPPLQLIKQACLEGGSTYEGRKKAVVHLTGAKHKVPIPINQLEQIYAFPTHSPNQFECSWIFHQHIRSITPLKTPKEPQQTMITFHNMKQLKLPVSYYSIEKQMQRTASCIIRFSHNYFERPPILPKPTSTIHSY
ncbi:hypothetical protein BKP45_21180 [Anaerobacillus alkalidiazotrophicus]|uniref:Competence protein n=1 Tax=Anaerobacillus alkalidiazotrophicus TaxID=472963 RepID=A0A1S2LWG8_9BACI|nr:competence protein ComK [Anaerobacillus alkalidiazotrophicus]OIJ16520.1 hypothetical protein BKP45_21180 [Anaerobacillus alkalidiazotrophicus]